MNSRRVTRTLLIILTLGLAVTLSIYLVRTEPPTRLPSLPTTVDSGTHPFFTSIVLKFKALSATDNQFTGSLTISVSPMPQQPDPKAFEKTLLRLSQDHFYVGGSEGTIALTNPPFWGGLEGKGTFVWIAEPKRRPFFYPFDSYVLNLDPELVQISDADFYNGDPIDAMSLEFGEMNLVPHAEKLTHNLLSGDSRKITLRRPKVLHWLAMVAGTLLIFWLFYIIWFATPEEHVGNLVTLFLGVFSIRASLLSGAPVFPSLIDYCSLTIYLAAVLVVLIKWVFHDRDKTTCRFCMSSIPLKARYCPQCTRHLENDERITAGT